MTGDTGNQLQLLGVVGRIFPSRKKTQLLNTGSKREISLSLGMKQVVSRKCSVAF